jgi:hypothetical protein
VTEAERLVVLRVYADWLEERDHRFESVCFRTGSDPADVLVGAGGALGLRRARFATHPSFRPGHLLIPLLGSSDRPSPERSYRSAAEARAAFLSAWKCPGAEGGRVVPSNEHTIG